MSRVASELDFQIAIYSGLAERCLRQTEAHSDNRKLRAARGLEHVEVAVTISGVEGFHRRGHQEVTLPGMADAFAARGVTDAIDFMNGMGHVIREGRLIQHPLLVSLTGRCCLRRHWTGNHDWSGNKESEKQCPAHGQS
jgi:hypothetical protein